ncbi:MAG: gluconate:H+ symporter [Bacteroidota bacterium]
MLRLKIQAFLALLVVSIVFGMLAGMPATDILNSVKSGMGSTLGFVAVVVGLGALFGAILEHSGGSQSLAGYLLQKIGKSNAPWAMVLTGFIVAIPVFFDVAFIILLPVARALSRQTGKSLLLYAIPLLAGLAITHSFIPPTPGPIAVAEILGADLGWVIIFGFVIGVPSAIISGPLFAKYISDKVNVNLPDLEGDEENDAKDKVGPSAGLIIPIIVLPIILIVLNTVFTGPLSSYIADLPQIGYAIALLGHPFTALIVANFVAWYLLGVRRGVPKEDLLKISTKSLYAAGVIILLTGAGGAFKQILVDTGAGKMLAESLTGDLFPPIVFAFILAALVRILQGSATVAMITAAGITAPLIQSGGLDDAHKALLVIGIASGATILSHINDSGFWLVSQYLGLSEKDTFRSWTVMTTLIALTGLVVSSVLWFVI